jgi:hypothetical protein
MKAYGEVNVYIHILLDSEIVGSEWSALHPGRFTPGERAPDSQWIGSWMGPRFGLYGVEGTKFLTLPRL